MMVFKLVDKKTKIYAKEAGTAPRPANLFPQRGLPALAVWHKIGSCPWREFRCRSLENGGSHHSQQVNAPAAVVIDQNLEVQQFRGRTETF